MWLKPERRNHRWARFTHGVLRRTVSGNKGGGKKKLSKRRPKGGGGQK